MSGGIRQNDGGFGSQATGDKDQGRSAETAAASSAPVRTVGIFWWPFSLACAAGFFVLGLVLADHEWAALGIRHLKPYFADTVAILASGQAQHAGLDPYAPNPFDPLHRPHVYGPLWLVTGALGLTVRDAAWIGPLLAIAFLASAAAILSPRNVRTSMAGLALLVSPPVLFAVERGNNDLVVFVLLAVAAWLVARGSRLTAASGAASLGLAAVLKMYPVAAFAVVAARPKRERLLIIVAASAVLLGLLANRTWLEDYRRALSLAPHPVSIFSYGAGVLIECWYGFSASRASLILGMVAGFGAAIPFWQQRAQLWRAVPDSGALSLLFVSGALTWGLCYFATTNYSYRFVLLLLPAGLWLRQTANDELRFLAWWQLGGWILVAWLLPVKRWLVVAAMNHGSAAVEHMMVAVAGFDAALATVLTVAGIVSGLGWVSRLLVTTPRVAGRP